MKFLTSNLKKKMKFKEGDMQAIMVTKQELIELYSLLGKDSERVV